MYTVRTPSGYTVVFSDGAGIGTAFFTDGGAVQTPDPPKSTLTREEALYDARKLLGDSVQAISLDDGICRMELNGSINDAPDWELALTGLQSLLKERKNGDDVTCRSK